MSELPFRSELNTSQRPSRETFTLSIVWSPVVTGRAAAIDAAPMVGTGMDQMLERVRKRAYASRRPSAERPIVWGSGQVGGWTSLYRDHGDVAAEAGAIGDAAPIGRPRESGEPGKCGRGATPRLVPRAAPPAGVARPVPAPRRCRHRLGRQSASRPGT